MEHTRRSSSSSKLSSLLLHLLLHLHLLVLAVLCSSGSARAYKNYTVGDSLGWYDNLEKPDVNYQNWVSDQQFSLGDFLIFNTDTNHSVVQTYNLTTYKLCDYNDAQDNDTFQWSSSNPSAAEPQPVSVAVPLLKEGMTYFFSSDYDGEQCKNGQKFKINVTYGQGLPESLKSPSDDSPSPASPVSGGDDDSAPDTIISSNFNNPKDQSEDDEKGNDNKHKQTSGSVSVSMCGSGSIILLGFAFFNFVLIS